MHMAVEGRTEAVDEAHRPESGTCAGATAPAQVGLDDAQEDSQDGAEGLRLALQGLALPIEFCGVKPSLVREPPVRTSCPAVRSAAIVRWTIGRSSPHWRTGSGGMT
jgi:hypothetical protein